MISTALTTFTFSMYLFVNDIKAILILMDLWNIPPQSLINITSFVQLPQGVMLLKMAFHEALSLSPRLFIENGLYLVNLFSLYPLESIFDNNSKSVKTIKKYLQFLFF